MNRDASFINKSSSQSDDPKIAEAVANISARVTARHSSSIAQLNERLENVCGHDLAAELNPLGPQCLNQNFLSALEPLDVHIKVLLTLLELFERYVADELDEVYDRANRVLIDADVLPELANSTALSSSERNPNQHIEEARIAERHVAVSAASSESARDFIHLQGLLATARDTGYFGNQYTEASATTPFSTQELIQKLDLIQAAVNTTDLDLNQPETVFDFRAQLSDSTPNTDSSESKESQQHTDDVIDLTRMLFEFVLNDRNIATPMQVLIARMQVPVLKVALMDQSLFSNANHPARQLLNELAAAGIGWNQASELKRDETYNRVESIVLRVLDGFGDDLTLFSNLIAELRHFIKKETQKRNQVEARVCETEAGKARTREAQKTVQTLINHKAEGLQLPAEAGRFIGEAWSKVLVYLFITQGTDSELWVQAIETLDDLLWTAQSFTSERDISRREQLLPHLLTQLEAGITVANLADSQELMISLRTVIDALHEADQIKLDGKAADPREAELEITTIEQPAIALLPQADTPPGEVETLADAPFIERVIRLAEGQWLELRENSGAVLRCKLATIVQPGNLYVFVNRKGLKVCERSRNTLALALQADELQLIDESELFDRALITIIDDLAQTRERQAS